MTITAYTDYFETAAKNNKSLLHDPTGTPKKISFFEIDIEDILNSAKLGMTDMSMLLECPEIRPVDNKSDNVRKMITGAFVILKEIKKGEGKRVVLDATLTVSEQIVAKMKNDNRKSVQDKTYLAMKGFDFNALRWQKVGPILSNCYGWRVEFTLDQTFYNNIQLDETNWNNETKFSIL